MNTSKALRRIGAALSLARILILNIAALAVATVAAVHVYNRQHNPRPAPIARGILAAHPTAAPRASDAAPAIEIEMEGVAPGGSQRVPASPSVNDVSRP